MRRRRGRVRGRALIRPGTSSRSSRQRTLRQPCGFPLVVPWNGSRPPLPDPTSVDVITSTVRGSTYLPSEVVLKERKKKKRKKRKKKKKKGGGLTDRGGLADSTNESVTSPLIWYIAELQYKYREKRSEHRATRREGGRFNFCGVHVGVRACIWKGAMSLRSSPPSPTTSLCLSPSFFPS